MFRTGCRSIFILLFTLLATASIAATSTVPALALTDAQPIRIGESLTLASKLLAQDRVITVYLPPGYEKGEQRYPVIYLLDGGAAEDFHHITGIVQVLTANNGMPPTIVVGIQNIERRHDLVGPSEVDEDRKIAPNAGGAELFRRFIAEELKPAIAARYRTGAQSTFLGESLAGLFVVETFLKQPDLFDTYIAISPSLWWNDQQLPKQAAELMQRHDYAGKTIYLTIANEGGAMRAGVDRFAAELQKRSNGGLRSYFWPMAGESHATALHVGAYRALRQLFSTADQPVRP